MTPNGPQLRRLELRSFRAFEAAVFEPDPDGTTVITGPNGGGKTTLLEAVAYLGTLRSFRGAPREAMVRTGEATSVVRAEIWREGRTVLVEAELAAAGRSRIQVNRQVVRARRDLAAVLPVSVFSPEDLAVVQGGPANRRDLLDDALRVLDRGVAAQLDVVDKVLRQRGALLRQAAGRRSPEVDATLAVWDDRLDRAGTAVAAAREELADRLGPYVAAAYGALAGAGPTSPVTLAYRRSWEGSLLAVLEARRPHDLRRGVTTAGPHRDDVVLLLAGRDARTQASQGEQRSIVLALRLAVHRLVTDRTGSPPLLLLDDVFSELDHHHSRALIEELPVGQALLTTAVPLPEGVEMATVLDVREVGA